MNSHNKWKHVEICALFMELRYYKTSKIQSKAKFNSLRIKLAHTQTVWQKKDADKKRCMMYNLSSLITDFFDNCKLAQSLFPLLVWKGRDIAPEKKYILPPNITLHQSKLVIIKHLIIQCYYQILAVKLDIIPWVQISYPYHLSISSILWVCICMPYNCTNSKLAPIFWLFNSANKINIS